MEIVAQTTFARNLLMLAAVALLLITSAACCVADSPPAPAPAAIEFFEKQVRPLLVDQCFGCHGPRATGANGGLKMLGRADLMKGGARGPAMVPGHPETSLLIKAVSYSATGLAMPPSARLTDAQIAILTDWIRRGAPWPAQKVDAGNSTVGLRVFNLQARKAAHWAWQPVKRHPVPAVRDRTWAESPIDAFILSKLETKGIKPAAPADRRTLIRRVTFDLIGLPPTQQEVNAFVTDRSPEAYAKVVDRLLASPHYGERWARHWLDLVRYGETDGHEFDLEKPGAYQYRDYVIRALNADVSYKRFAMEQLAGDLLAKPRLNPIDGYNESILGTGFYWLGSGTHSPVDTLDDQADHMDNEIDVLSKTFLGIGVACARCHDHKFDAVSQKDYYGLFGILSSTRMQFAPVGRSPDPSLLRDLRSVRSEINRTLVSAVQSSIQSPGGFSAYASQSKVEADPNDPTHPADPADPLYPWAVLYKTPSDRFGAEKQKVLERLQELAESASREENAIEWFAGPGANTSAGWTASGLAFGDMRTTNGGLDVRLNADKTHPVAGAFCASIADSGLMSDRLHGDVRSRTFIIDKPRVLYRMAGHGARIRFVVDGLLQLRDPLYGGLAFEPDSDSMKWYEQDVSRWIGHRAYIELQDVDPGFVALDRVGFALEGAPKQGPSPLVIGMLQQPDVISSDRLERAYSAMLTAVVSNGAIAQGPLQRNNDDILAWAVRRAQLTGPVLGKLLDLTVQQSAIEQRIVPPSPALAAADGNGENERVHIRGNYRTPGPNAPRRFLESCDGTLTFDNEPGSGRMKLAERITAPTDPLFARVMVNRLWQHHFGEGIVRTPDDFGVMGVRPTHPELLDWLASEFVRVGWSIKAMHRLMVMSNAYRMDSRSDAKSDAADPQNLLLHKMTVHRMEAECIRDSILAISGRLDATVCGPPVMPNMNAFTPGRGAPASGPVDGAGRRSIYISVRRGFPVPMLSAFDLPVPMTTVGRRTVSSVPAQALTLLNDPFVVGQAKVWAKRILDNTGTAQQRIGAMYESAFARAPDLLELRAATAFISERKFTSNNPDELQAWTDLGHVLFNVKEFIFLR